MRSAFHRRLVAAVLLGLAGSVAVADDDPVSARAFEVRHRALSDAAELIDPLLSSEGKIILRPRLRTLVVEDHGQVLGRVAAVLESWDLPARNAEVTLTLFLGIDTEEESGPSRGPADALGVEHAQVVHEADFRRFEAAGLTWAKKKDMVR